MLIILQLPEMVDGHQWYPLNSIHIQQMFTISTRVQCQSVGNCDIIQFLLMWLKCRGDIYAKHSEWDIYSNEITWFIVWMEFTTYGICYNDVISGYPWVNSKLWMWVTLELPFEIKSSLQILSGPRNIIYLIITISVEKNTPPSYTDTNSKPLWAFCCSKIILCEMGSEASDISYNTQKIFIFIVSVKKTFTATLCHILHIPILVIN